MATLEPHLQPYVEHQIFKVGNRKVGYLLIRSFNNQFVGKLATERADLLVQGKIDSLIIDVRGNEGGLPETCAEVAGLVLPADVPFCSLATSPTEIYQEVKTPRSLHLELPVVVLVDHSTVSISEVLAAVIQGYERGYVLGEQTPGKARFQTVFDAGELPGPLSKVKMQVSRTSGQVKLPSGSTYHEVGIEPDVHFKLIRGARDYPRFPYGPASSPFFPPVRLPNDRDKVLELVDCARARVQSAVERRTPISQEVGGDPVMMYALHFFQCLKVVPGPHRGYRSLR